MKIAAQGKRIKLPLQAATFAVVLPLPILILSTQMVDRL